jgi:hypothetical protein
MKHRFAEHKSRTEKDSKLGKGGNSVIKSVKGFDFYKVETKRTKFRFVPYIVGKGNPFADEGTAYYERTFHGTYIPDASGNRKMVVCPDRLADTDPRKDANNPIRDIMRKAWDSGDEDLGRSLKQAERQVFLIRDVSDTSKDKKKVYLWEVAHNNFGKLLDETLDEDENKKYRNFWNPDGYIVKIKWTEKKMGKNTYFEAADIEFEKAEHEIPEHVWTKMPCLDDLLNVPTQKQLAEAAKIVSKGAKDSDDDDDSDSDDDEEDSKPVKKGLKLGKLKKLSSLKKKKVDPDEQEGEDEDW